MSHDSHKSSSPDKVQAPDCSKATLEDPALSLAELQEAFEKANQ